MELLEFGRSHEQVLELEVTIRFFIDSLYV